MIWLSEDRSIGLYGSTHLYAEVPEIEKFLSELDPMLVMVETEEKSASRPDMQAAIEFARSRKRQVAYICFDIGDAVRGLGEKYPLHTTVHFGIITCQEQSTKVATEEELRRRVQFVVYDVVEDINPFQKISVLKEAIEFMDRYVAEMWKERGRFSTPQGVQEAKRGIEEKEVQEPIDGFGQYHEEYKEPSVTDRWY